MVVLHLNKNRIGDGDTHLIECACPFDTVCMRSILRNGQLGVQCGEVEEDCSTFISNIWDRNPRVGRFERSRIRDV